MGESWVGAGWTPERRRAEVRAGATHSRALVPRDNPPNDNGDGPNDPPVSVGPTSSEGFGNTHVMQLAGLPQVQAWSGWPVEWSTPSWGSSIGLDAAMSRVSTIWQCLDVNASITASFPNYLLHDGRPVAESQWPQWMRNPQPEEYTSWDEALMELMISYQLGEAFVWATSRYPDTGAVRTWMILERQRVQCSLEYGVRRYYLDGKTDITDDVLHLRYAKWGADLHGHGPLEAAATNIASASALETYAAGLARRGGIPWAVLKWEGGDLPAGKAAELQAQWVTARQNAWGAPAVLSGNLDLTPLTLSPKEMALIEIRAWDESRIANLLQVPPFLAGLPSGGDSMTYSNVISLFDYHWRMGLRPKAQRVMKGISNWALPPGRRAELDRTDYTSPGIVEMATAYATLHGIEDDQGNKAITVPEIRARERNFGLAPASGGVR